MGLLGSNRYRSDLNKLHWYGPSESTLMLDSSSAEPEGLLLPRSLLPRVELWD